MLFGIFYLIFLNHSSLCFGEAKSKSAQKSIEIQLKLIDRSPLNSIAIRHFLDLRVIYPY